MSPTHQLDDLTSLQLPAEEPDHMSAGPAWPDQARRQRAAVRQEPQPEVTPSVRVLQTYEQAHTGADRAEPEREAE